VLIQAKNSVAGILLVISVQLVMNSAALADCAIPVECPRPAQVEEMTRNLSLYHEAMTSRQYAEAEVLAKRVMEFSIVINGLESIDSAHALSNLAFVQQRQEQYEPARLNFQSAIRSIEQVDGVLSPALIRPLQGLGDTALAAGEIVGARLMFERAVHISHVNDGPQNTAQIGSLEAIAETYFAAGQVKGTRDIQSSIFALNSRKFGSENIELIPALHRHADWMRRLHLHNRARTANLKILRLQEKHLDDDDPAIIPILIELAVSPNNYRNVLWDSRYHGTITGPDHYLNRAMRVAAAQPEEDWELATDTTIAVGDYFTMAHRFSRARYAYAKAWKRMSDNPDAQNARSEKLERPILLKTPYLPEFYRNQVPVHPPPNNDGFSPGSITAKFDVSSSGKVVNVDLIESQPPVQPMIAGRFEEALKYVMHRPRMENGAMVDTTGLIYHYEFLYQN
jgi:tetratricopeptide (TPR) repeat protein